MKDPDDKEIIKAFFDDATFADGTFDLPKEARWSTIINTAAPQLNVADEVLTLGNKEVEIYSPEHYKIIKHQESSFEYTKPISVRSISSWRHI